MIAYVGTNKIVASQGGEGWTTTINGVASGIKPAKYKRVAVRQAVKHLQEQEQEQQKTYDLKELGL